MNSDLEIHKAYLRESSQEYLEECIKEYADGYRGQEIEELLLFHGILASAQIKAFDRDGRYLCEIDARFSKSGRGLVDCSTVNFRQLLHDAGYHGLQSAHGPLHVRGLNSGERAAMFGDDLPFWAYQAAKRAWGSLTYQSV
jgi:hypothetical protein